MLQIINILFHCKCGPHKWIHAGFTGVAVGWLEKVKPILVEQASLQIVRYILPDMMR
jgi:hypothetical protein